MALGIPNGTDLRQFYYLGSNKQPLNAPPTTYTPPTAATTAKPTSGSLYLSQAYTNKANQTGQGPTTTLSESLIPLVTSTGVDTITATTTSTVVSTKVNNVTLTTPSPLTAGYAIKVFGRDVDASLAEVSLQLNGGNDVVSGTALLSPVIKVMPQNINRIEYFYLTGIEIEGTIYGGILQGGNQAFNSGNDSVTGVGTYRGIANTTGFISLGDGADKLTGTAGNTNIIGSAGIYNEGAIALGVEATLTTPSSVIAGDNDTVTATGTYTGLYNSGDFGTNAGNDTITAKAGTLFNQQTGLFNDQGGTIDLGSGNDTVTSTGYTAILNEGDILFGTGTDKLTATGTFFGLVNKGVISFDANTTTAATRSIVASGSISGLVNNGTIEFLGTANDTVTVSKGGISGDLGTDGEPLGSINFGAGNDTLTGFGTGIFDGGDGVDTVILPSNTAYHGLYKVAPTTTGGEQGEFILTGIQNITGIAIIKNFNKYNANQTIPTLTADSEFILTIAANGSPTISALPGDWAGI